METDRELLELAAMAVGAKPSQEDGVIYAGFGSREWNPLTDDGDALRLAVKVKLLVDTDHCCAMPIYKSGSNPDDWSDGELEDDPYESTRRAIVRAAAAIGREKQNEASNGN